MTSPIRSLTCAWLTALTSLTVGCAAEPEAVTELAEESTDSALTGQSEAALLAALADGAAAATPAAAAARIGLRAGFTPAGCATRTTAGATTTVQLVGCTGPRGLVSIDGTATITVTAADPGSIALTAAATGLRINGATLDLALSATYSAAGGAGSLAVTSQSSGAGPRGYSVTHTGEYTATWDAACATVDGDWATSGELGVRALAVTVTRCRAGCPTGTVTRTRRDGSTVSVVLDGTATAAWSSTRRGAGTFPLPCTP
jgi:hypothetical protein